MTQKRPRTTCRAPGCHTRTRSITGHCGHHRDKIPVSLDLAGMVNIGALTITPEAALELVDRIVDTIETGA